MISSSKEIKNKIMSNNSNRNSGLVIKDDVVEKIKSDTIKNDKNPNQKNKKEVQSNLTSVEKIRYKNIGESFTRGGRDMFSSIYLKIKSQEIKKVNEQLKTIINSVSSLKEEKKKEYKEKKKKSKAKTIAKFALFGAAMGAAVFVLKKTYDTITNFSKKLNMKEEINTYSPKSMTYHAPGSKMINGQQVSYVVKTSSGEEISISNTTNKNEIEAAAKTTDELLANNLLGRKGLDGFLNPKDVNKSLIGYIIFKPLESFVNLARNYFSNSIQNPKLGRLYKDFFWQISWITDMISDKINSMTYKGKYSGVVLSSQDAYLNAKAKLKESINDLFGAKNKNRYGMKVINTKNDQIKVYFPSYSYVDKDFMLNDLYKRDVYFTLPNSRKMYETLEYIADSMSYEDVAKIANDLKNSELNFEKGKFEKKGNKGSTVYTNMYITSKKGNLVNFINNLHAGKKFNQEDYKTNYDKFNINFTNNEKGTLYIGSFENMEDFWNNEFEELKSNNVYELQLLENFFTDEISKLLIEIKGRKMYLDEILSARDENIKKILKDKINLIQDDYDVHYNEEMIYGEGKSTREKMNLIIESCFSKREDKHIFLRFLRKMEDEVNMIENDLYMIFEKFSYRVNPLAFFFKTEPKSAKEDQIGYFVKQESSKATKIVAEKNDIGVELMMNDKTYFTKIVHHSNSKLRFRKQKIKALYNTLIFLKKEIKKNCNLLTGEKGNYVAYDEMYDLTKKAGGPVTMAEDAINTKRKFSDSKNPKDIIIDLRPLKDEIMKVDEIKIPNEKAILSY